MESLRNVKDNKKLWKQLKIEKKIKAEKKTRRGIAQTGKEDKMFPWGNEESK